MSDIEVLVAFGAALTALLLALLVTRDRSRRTKRSRDKSQTTGLDRDDAPENAILVDGSNVMHWGGEPSVTVVQQVIASLEREGFAPFVCFDANAGYKLIGHYMDAWDLAPSIGVTPDRILVVDRGVVADEVILAEAGQRGLKVVSNDRFRDWTDQHPWVKNHKRFRRGTWKQGSVVWQSGKKR